MFSRFFIDRPIFASVISIVITMVGAIALYQLPLAQYPPIAPPTVEVGCNYPGASAQTVAETVAAPIEQQVNGVEDMLYMNSSSTNDGSYALTVTFKPGVDLNLAQVLVQNRVSLAIPSLPEVVRRTGVTTRKRSPDILLTVSLNSPDGRYDQLYLSNYARLHLLDEISRLRGVSEVRVFGQRDYSMRIWLDPDKLAARNLSVTDVQAAIRDENREVALGQLGQPPSMNGQMWQIPLTVKGRLETPEAFANIIVRTGAEGRILRIRDIGRVEVASRTIETNNRFNQKPTVGLAIFQLPDANALETADLVKAKMAELSVDFPEGVIYEAGYDTTPFIRESINEVFKSLRDAVILVALVVLVFLQGWRPAIIPLIAVPVAIVGTFAAMVAAGFSLNNLTLFGLVLAIGIVVDDAIVVVEAVEQYIERGFAPREAAIKAMEEVTGPVIAVGLVLSAVFIPCAFVSGIVGQFFRQFALTIAISTVISTINSLTLSPALAALLLRPKHGKKDWLTWLLDFLFGWFFRLFNFGMQKSINGYAFATSRLLRVPVLVLLVYGGLLGLTYFGFNSLPRGFIPSQDKGYLVCSVQLPDATSAERTLETLTRVESLTLDTPGVRSINSIAGNSFQLGARASNFCSMFVILEEFEKRQSPETTAASIQESLLKKYAKNIPEATVTISPPPAVSGLGRAGGIKLMVEDRGDIGLKALQEQTDNLVRKGTEQPQLKGLLSVFNVNAPQLYFDVDRDACLSQGISLGEVFGTLQGYLGSRYVNDFNMYGRTWQVVVQADEQYRDRPEDVRRLKVRNRDGKMVPLGAVANVRMIGGPLMVTRYNMYPAAAITANIATGVSSGEGIQVLEEVALRELPSSMAAEWTELAYLERTSGSTGLMLFLFSVVFVFLVLAALYESWSLPLAVILVVPMCVLCSIAGVAVAELDINIFTQIGFVVLIGLACKNAILIVEFAKLRRDAGEELHASILAACRLRLRPILMTSFAFILGVVPLVIAKGAGFEMRRALGTAVFSGMLGVTLFGIFLTPVFFLVVDRLSHWSLFSHDSRLFRAGHFVMDILRLGFLRRPARAAFATVSRDRAAVRPPASVDHD
ncbi:MAG: multidrug efflux RND transporter permease subunit [Planctomycetota bacterium]|nr:MAG: multidrug efflux RND transporter permease subunit [Planctomycetota bacterium]